MRRLRLLTLSALVTSSAWAVEIPNASFSRVLTTGMSVVRIAAAPDETLWAIDRGATTQVVQLRPPSSFVAYPLGSLFGSNPLPIDLTVGPDGSVWFTVEVRKADGSHQGSSIGKLSKDGILRNIPLPTASAFTGVTDAGITAGPDGNVWFVEPTAGKVGRVTPDGIVNEYAIGTPSSSPRSITSGSDGNLWFTETAGKIGRATPTGSITEFTVPDGATGKGRPYGIAAGPDGQVYFTDPGQGRVGRVTPAGAITMFPIPSTTGDPAGLVAAADGNVYFALRAAGRIGQLALDTLKVTESPFPFSGSPFQLIRTVPGILLTGPEGLPSLRVADVMFTMSGGTPAWLGRMTAGDGCVQAAPRAPQVGQLPGSIPSGGSLRVPVSTTDTGVSLQIEVSCLPDVSVPVYRDRADGRELPDRGGVSWEFVVPTAAIPCSTFHVRALARRDCKAGRLSSVQSVGIERPLPSYLASPASVDLRMQKGGTVAEAALQLKNLTSLSAYVALTNEGDFFKVTPGDLTLEPQESRYVFVSSLASAAGAPGRLQGALTFGTSRGEPLLRVPVTLTVSEALPGSSGGLLAAPDSLVVAAPAGGTPPAASTTVTAAAPASPALPLFVSLEGPGAAARVVDAPVVIGGAPVPVRVAVDRSRRLAVDGPGPWLTRFRVETGVAEEVTSFALWDHETVDHGPGVPRPGGVPLEPSMSFVVPSVVNARSGQFGTAYLSDGWLRNEDGSGPSEADLIYTPDWADGVTDPAVTRAAVSIPAGATMRMHDVVGMFLGQTGSGQLEVRPRTPGSLSLRMTVDASSDVDPTFQFSGEVPAYGSSAGITAAGLELTIPGVVDDASARTNLILGETSGRGVRAVVTLRDENGRVLGTAGPVDVPPYGKIQMNRVVRDLAGGSVSLGTLTVGAVQGEGTLVALATVIDSASSSFRVVPGSPIGAAGLDNGVAQLVVPSAAHLTGAFDTRFTTDLYVANGSDQDARVKLIYHYVVRDSGETGTVTHNLGLGPRTALPAAYGRDAIVNLFGLAGETSGWIEVLGDVYRIAVSASVSAQVDPADPSRGQKSSRIETVSDVSRATAGALSLPRSFAGAEKSTRKRTSLILVETAGLPITARVRAHDKAGRLLGERAFSLLPYQYRQLTDVFGSGGLSLGDGPFVDATLAVDVQTGGGRLVAVATVNDNLSRSPAVYVLKDPGPQGMEP